MSAHPLDSAGFMAHIYARLCVLVSSVTIAHCEVSIKSALSITAPERKVFACLVLSYP